MWRFILLLILITIVYYIVRFLTKPLPFSRKKGNRNHEPEELVQDPYCQTYIPKGSAVKKRIGGKDYYFCSRDCLKKYLKKS